MAADGQEVRMDTQLLRTSTRMQRVTLPVYNLGCAGGGALTVERVLQQTPGVGYVYVNPATEMAYVEYDPSQVETDALTTAIESVGFGAPRLETRSAPLLEIGVMPRLDSRRWALAGGVWLAAIYTLCVVADLLFPQVFHMRVLWEILFVNFDWTHRWTLLPGVIQAFVYGAFGAWSFAMIYNTLPDRRASGQPQYR